MAFDKQYYEDKQKKIADKLRKKQNDFISDILNTSLRFINDNKDINTEAQELRAIIAEKMSEVKKTDNKKELPKTKKIKK